MVLYLTYIFLKKEKSVGNYQVPVPTKIFHITCIDNLHSILPTRRMQAKNRLDQTNIKYRNIAYDNIQDKRKNTPIPIQPGGCLLDYVPFYFAPRSPMLDAIRRGKVVGYEGNQEDICYLVTDAQKISNAGLGYIFSNGHAIMQPLQLFNSLEQLNQVDWEIFFEPPLLGGYAKFWLDNPSRSDKPKWVDRRRRRQSEFLVYNSLALELVTEIATMNEQKKLQVQSILVSYGIQIPVIIKPEWYYD